MAAPGWLHMGEPGWLRLGDPGWRRFPDPGGSVMRRPLTTPWPETNLLICHGMLAPRARWRERVVVYRRLAPEPTASTALRAAGLGEAGVQSTPRAWT